ncbi:MAG: sigma-70 family RNA polymerase sigma factor [Pseudomonadota bacterium]
MEERETRWNAWMQSALDGDRRAYEAVLAAIAERTRAYAGSRLHRSGRGAEEVEDIVQDVLIAVHTKRETWQQGRPIGPWVDAIIRYKTVDALRRFGRRQTMVSDTFDHVAETMPAPAQTRPLDLVGEVGRHLSTLSQRERSVVSALGIDGMTIAACARRLGISEGAVRVAFHRGIARLAKAADADTSATVTRASRSLASRSLASRSLG